LISSFSIGYISPFFIVGTVEAGVVNAGPEPVVAGTLLSGETAGDEFDGVVVATGLVAGEVGIVYRVESVLPRDDVPPSVDPLLPSEEDPVEGVENVVALEELPNDGDVEVRLPNALLS
jgi:hypothetical protein